MYAGTGSPLGLRVVEPFTPATYPAGNRHLDAWSASSTPVTHHCPGGSMQNAQTLVTKYLETFNETDGDRRRDLLEALYAPDCSYTDPHVDLQGTEQIDGFIKQTHERFPGVTFTLGGPVDAH